MLRFTAPAAATPLARAPLSTEPLPKEPEVPSPWPGRDLPVGAAVLHVRDTPGTGPVRAVYLHGLAGSATNWTELAGLLADRAPGLAVDLPGFGLSRPPDNDDYSLLAQANRVIDLLTGPELAGQPVHLFGNSMGGAIALLIAAARPELVHTLTLISPAMPDLRPDPHRLSDPRVALAFLPLVGRRARRELAELTPQQRTEALLRLCFADPDRVSAARLDLAVAEQIERLKLPWAGPAIGHAASEIVRTWMAPARRSLWATARKVSVPTLVIWGTEDRVITVRRAARTTRSLARGRLLVLTNTGHAAQMERPVTVARAVLGMWSAVPAGEW